MKNKTKASLLALTLLVSQQMNCAEQQPKAPENKSLLTWKNAGIAAAVAGTGAAAAAAYYYKDAIGEIINQLRVNGATNIDAATVNAEILSVVEDTNVEVAKELNDIATKQQEVAKLQQLLSLPDDQQIAIITENVKGSSEDVTAPMAEATAMDDLMPTESSALEVESTPLSETISVE